MVTQTDALETVDAQCQSDISLPQMDRMIVTNQHLYRKSDDLQDQIHAHQQQENKYIEKIHHMTGDIQQLNEDVAKLQQEKKILSAVVEKAVLRCENIEKDDKMTEFYTGLSNFSTFVAIHDATKELVRRKNTKLSSRDELLLTIVKLRRNLKLTDLAYRFGIAPACATTIFHVWLSALYISIGGLVQWPESDVCQLPPIFQNSIFRKVKCVIDCTEIFIERPTNLKARAQTYSNYKKHNTIKILVGVSPTGCVTFLSECWGGRVSDKQITLESGILDKLCPGDVILADRGFNVEEEFSIRGAKLIVPAYTRGKKQLSKKEVEESRMMARARIHVERVIGRLKDFEIMKGTLPVRLVKKEDGEMVTTGDKIVRVVAALVNTNGPLL